MIKAPVRLEGYKARRLERKEPEVRSRRSEPQQKQKTRKLESGKENKEFRIQ
jgi:hypothetical protein